MSKGITVQHFGATGAPVRKNRFAVKSSIGEAPQRFRYRFEGSIKYGVCYPNEDGSWTMTTSSGLAATFSIDLEVAIQIVLGRNAESIEWIDLAFVNHALDSQGLK